MAGKENIGVVGAGTMGTGVAHLFAAAGHQVVLVDTAEAALTRSRELIERNVALYPLVDPALPRLDPAEVTGRIVFSANPHDLKNSDFVVENVTEKREVKEALYPQLDSICPPHCVIGVNTSAISITRLAGRTERPDRVIGTHIMNPAPLKPLVEVIRGTHTSAETVDRTQALFRQAGRDSIVVNDAAGFVTNRVMMLTVNEAIFLLHEGVADSAADIDRLFKDCFGHRMGPLATADLIGLDTVLLSLEVIHDSLRDSKYRPCPLLTRLVDAGLHGVKSGRGFYDYA
ncbi:3-hydroxyacyl-CoA dehydrogenase family protein [Amycolatopsis sp. 195334CR]|uniref:3-hydroxyacyl-CoA dehydrogenase family protein n=1 Tax=Amycolatopsis sp. 195334CR TaxID=2814588 RepID=UPI001A8FBEC9|nr:3-hydroxyacyl-CoA dehydrogenase family protein [Amycolatopsis sp. 195334CR]MBN6042347.1 3-hydroxyacyl-CoA dehydrogenase family protein [Amycolatopsis sp. 195334CR]